MTKSMLDSVVMSIGGMILLAGLGVEMNWLLMLGVAGTLGAGIAGTREAPTMLANLLEVRPRFAKWQAVQQEKATQGAY